MRVKHHIIGNAAAVNALHIQKSAQFGEESAPFISQVLHNHRLATGNNQCAARLAFHAEPFAVEL